MKRVCDMKLCERSVLTWAAVSSVLVCLTQTAHQTLVIDAGDDMRVVSGSSIFLWLENAVWILHNRASLICLREILLWSLNSNEISQICHTWPFFMACRTRRSRPAACSSSVGIPETNVCDSKKMTSRRRRCHLWFISCGFWWCHVYCCGLQLRHVAAGCRQTSRDQTARWWWLLPLSAMIKNNWHTNSDSCQQRPDYKWPSFRSLVTRYICNSSFYKVLFIELLLLFNILLNLSVMFHCSFVSLIRWHSCVWRVFLLYDTHDTTYTTALTLNSFNNTDKVQHVCLLVSHLQASVCNISHL